MSHAISLISTVPFSFDEHTKVLNPLADVEVNVQSVMCLFVLADELCVIDSLSSFQAKCKDLVFSENALDQFIVANLVDLEVDNSKDELFIFESFNRVFVASYKIIANAEYVLPELRRLQSIR